MNYLSRLLQALFLCAGIILSGCSEKSSPIVEGTDLSSTSSANCYIVSQPGKYSFKTVQGNSSASVGEVSSVETLWETFGTEETPSVGDLVKNISHKNGIADNYEARYPKDSSIWDDRIRYSQSNYICYLQYE